MKSLRSLFAHTAVTLFLLAGWQPVLGQGETKFTPQIVLDKAVKAGDLTCFPQVGNDKRYYYLPNQPKVALHEDGTPVFSFLRWVENVRSGSESPEAREGGGGGIVHVLFGLSVSEDQKKEAEQELRRIAPAATLVGPVIYQSGTCALITSPPEEGEKKVVVGIGPAPVMDGDFVAVSIRLSRKESQLLWETFKTPTPDISFTFNMMLGGYNSPIKAKVTFNRDQIYKHKNFQAGLATPMFAGEIGIMTQDLIDNGSIKVEMVGSDEQMEKLVDQVQQKFIEEFTTPMGSSNAPSFSSLGMSPGQQSSFLDRATQQYNQRTEQTQRANTAIRQENREEMARARQDEQSRQQAQETSGDGQTAQASNDSTAGSPRSRRIQEGSSVKEASVEDKPSTPPPYQPQLQEQQSAPMFYGMASFQMKTIRVRGTKVYDFEKSLATSINQTFSKNIGKINCRSCFREVNLDDPLYKQREIVAMIDGMNAQDFGQYVNFVTLSVRKKHQSGEITNDEVRIDRKNFNKEGNNFKLLYGWKGDNDRSKWFDYQYRASWSFFGGHQIQGDWKPGRDGALSLTPPFQRKLVDLEGDPEELKENNVRLVNVIIFYKLGEQEQSVQTSLNPKNDIFSKRIDFILPKGVNDYEYEITWIKKGNETKTSGRKKYSGNILFVDEI